MDIDLNRRLLEFLPISFLFFSLTYWENLNWTTTALVNIPVIFFSLLAIYLLLPGGRSNRLELVCCWHVWRLRWLRLLRQMAFCWAPWAS